MADQFIGQTLANKYRIEEGERESGLGKIYRGTHLLMDKPVTVKILSPALAVDDRIVNRFSTEAKTVSQISHPNVLNVTDFGTDPKGAVYIISEGAEGETLKESILHEGKFPLERAVKIVRQIAAALTAAHRKGVVHQHLNSGNILLTRAADDSEFVKVLDFGSIKTEDDAFENEADLKDLEYLAPEQNASVYEADERSDIYSLGVIFYEMLTGEVPFTAENPTTLMMKQAEEPPAPLSAFRSDLPAGIEPIILKALAKSPEMRYQTAGEFSDDLLHASIDAGMVKTATSAAAADSGNIWKTAFIVLVGIALLSGGLIYFLSSKRTDPATALQTDVGGQPVQPLNPATGFSEQSLSNMTQIPPEIIANSNTVITPGAMPGGDGYNPWGNGVNPPPGAPTYVPPNGQMIDPTNPNSVFMDDGNTYYIVPSPTNSNVNVQPSPTPKGAKTPVPANTQPTPPATTDKPQPTPEVKPTVQPKTDKTPAKPVDQPKTNKPSATEKQVQSDKKQDTD